MLPTCPACKQSVLDDDATECPFCGANMKTGKGGGTRSAAPSKPVAPAAKSSPTPPPASKSATNRPTSKPAARKSSLDDDDDPFAAGEDDDPFAAATKQDAANKANAIAVTSKKTRTHVVELKCPMCDTVGFVPENVGGKDVKCCNPKCPVPVFMAPKKYGAPAPIAPPPKKIQQGPSKKPLIFAIIGGVAFVAAVGLAVLFWPEAGGPVKETDFKALAEQAKKDRAAKGLPEVTVTGGKDGSAGTNDPKVDNVDPAEAAKPALDVVHLLKLMEDHSLEERLVNKKYCRQRTAIGYATVNDAAGMRSQFQKLDQIESTLQHFKIPAYLALGWQQLAAGHKAEAAKTAEEALEATKKIGKGSRDTQEAVIDLAAYLVANAKVAAAHKLLADHFVQDASTPLVVKIAYARHQGDFNFDQDLPGTSVNPQCAWGAVGVTLILMSEGFSAEAQQWAEGYPDPEAQADCVLAWSDASLRAAIALKQPADSAVESIGSKLLPGGKVRLLARLALTQSAAGNNADAEKLVAAAREVLKTIPVPNAARFEGFKEALEWKAPDATPLQQAVLGAAELGRAQAKLNKPDEGWISMIEALKFARALAPSPAATAGLKAEASDVSLDTLRDKLRMELNLNSRDEATRKARELLNKLELVESQGLDRFRLQEAVLQTAVEAGLGIQVWREILSLSQRSDLNELEPYLSGTLPLYLIQQFNSDGLPTEAAEVNAKINGTELPSEEVLELQHQLADLLKDKKLREIVAIMSRRRLVGRTEEFALQTLVQAARQPDQAISTLLAVSSMDTRTSNQFVKLEALRLLAAYAARRGNPVSVRDAIQSQKLTALEKVSAYLGVLEGFEAGQRNQAEPQTDIPKNPAPKSAI